MKNSTKTILLMTILFFALAPEVRSQTWTLMDTISNGSSGGATTTNMYDFSSDGTHGMVSRGWTYRSTTDAGVTWSANKNIENRTIKVMKVISNNVALAGADYKIFKTIDFGTTWTFVSTGIFNGDIRDIKIVNTRCIAVSNNGEVAYSSNSGDTWTKIIPNPFGNIGAISYVEMINSSVAYLVGANIKKTVDGGVTWTNVTGTVLSGNTFYSPTSGCYSIESNGSTPTKLYRTSDSGLTWTVFNTGNTLPGTVYCLNASTYYGTISNVNKIYKSTDAGATWTVDYTSPYAAMGVHSIKFSGTYAYAIVDMASGFKWARLSGLPVAVSENNFSSQNVVIYPNPGNGKFTIDHQNRNHIISVKVYTILGEEIFTNNLPNEASAQLGKPQTTNSFEIDISTSPKGIYFVKLSDGEKIYNRKIVIE